MRAFSAGSPPRRSALAARRKGERRAASGFGIGRVEVEGAHAAFAQVADAVRAGGRQLVQAAVAVDHEARRGCPASPSTSASDLRQGRVVHADDLVRGAGRVGQRAEQVEDGALAQLAARADRVFHGRVEARRKQEADADLVDAAATCSGVRSRLTPRAASTSALPQLDDAARLPCLATFRPAPAMTNAAVVEMLKVWAPSPPVPAVSSSGAFEGHRQWRRGRAWPGHCR